MTLVKLPQNKSRVRRESHPEGVLSTSIEIYEDVQVVEVSPLLNEYSPDTIQDSEGHKRGFPISN